jgi:proline iminopeptidase
MSPVIPPPRESGQTTRTALPLHWAAWGPAGAPRLLVLHGGPGAHHDYLLPQLLHLAERHDCLFYDQRGGGRSKHDDVGIVTWRTQVDDLAAVADELLADDAPLHLVGYSWGGLLALLYAIEAAEGGHALPVTLEPVGTAHPAPRRRPASLTLIDPAPITRAWRVPFEAEMAQRAQSPAVQAMRAELAASGLRERDPDAYRQRSFELSVAGYFHDPARARDLTPFRVTGRVQQSVWESLGEYDLRPHLATLDVPTMVVHGREDPIPLASSEALAAGIPGAALVVLDDCGHVPYVEQPAALFAALDPWLARVVG